MGRNKQIEKPLTIEMQFNVDVNNLIAKREKEIQKTYVDKIDCFHNLQGRWGLRLLHIDLLSPRI